MASELNVGGVKVGDGTANQNWVQVHSTAAQIAGVKLFRGDGDSSDASNNNFGVLVTDSGCEISKFTAGGANITGRVPFLTIDANGNAGLGVTPETDWDSAHSALQIGLTGSIVSGTATNGWTQVMKNARYVGGGVYKYITTDEASSYQQKNDGSHVFAVAASGTADAAITWTDALIIESSGVCQFKNGLSFDQTNTAASGASATSGVMSHYETGTWTPTVAGATSVGTYSYYARYGYYTRIGNQVTLQFTIWNVTADSAGSGSLIITGLPWPTRNQADTSNVGSVGVDTVTNAGSTHLFLRTAHNASHVEIWKSADGAADDKVAVTDVSSGTTDIYGQITYLI